MNPTPWKSQALSNVTLASAPLTTAQEAEMNIRVFVLSGLAITVAMVGIVWIVPADAQSAVPRTAWGEPDLQGILDFRTITPLQRPKELADQEFLTEDEASSREQVVVDRNAELLNAPPRRTEAGKNVGAYNNFWMDRGTTVVGTRRTSLIVDPPNGRLPSMTESGKGRADAGLGSFSDDAAWSYTDLTTADRCILGFNAGPPITPAGYNQNMQLFQTSDYVVILNEMIHNARIIPLDGRPRLDDGIPQWSGDSRGHWEGDTLVIETTTFNDQRQWRGPPSLGLGAATSQNMKVVERLTRVDADTLEYRFTVIDPETWASSWTASVPMRRTDQLMYEFACHEGNYGLTNMLAGARAEEAASEAVTQ